MISPLEPELATLLHQERLAAATARHRLAELTAAHSSTSRWRDWLARLVHWRRRSGPAAVPTGTRRLAGDSHRAHSAPDRA